MRHKNYEFICERLLQLCVVFNVYEGYVAATRYRVDYRYRTYVVCYFVVVVLEVDESTQAEHTRE